MSTTIREIQERLTIIKNARQATSTLRDFVRLHGMDFRTRDPLVMAIHDALDIAEKEGLR